MTSILPISFDECLNRLMQQQKLVPFDEYIDFTKNIPFDIPIFQQVEKANELIKFMVTIANSHPNDFMISVTEIEKFGVVIKNTLTNKYNEFRNKPIDTLRNNYAFLKRNKLKQNVDFSLNTIVVDDSREDRPSMYESILGYKITRPAFYKILNNIYNRKILISLDVRIIQLTSNYYKYIDLYYTEYTTSLKQTIFGLNEDISSIYMKHSNSSKSVVSNDVTGDDPKLDDHTILHYCDYCDKNSYRDSYESSASYVMNSSDIDDVSVKRMSIDINKKSNKSYPNNCFYVNKSPAEPSLMVSPTWLSARSIHANIAGNTIDEVDVIDNNDSVPEAISSWSVYSSSPINTILGDSNLSNELETMHNNMYNIINSPVESLSKLTQDFKFYAESESSSIPTNLFKHNFNENHINTLRKRFSTCLNNDPVSMDPLRVTSVN